MMVTMRVPETWDRDDEELLDKVLH
jgi:hypothetical protein